MSMANGCKWVVNDRLYTRCRGVFVLRSFWFPRRETDKVFERKTIFPSFVPCNVLTPVTEIFWKFFS